METKINGEIYKVNVIRKNNKNIYFRVKEDLEIYVTAPYLTSDKKIEKLLKENESSLLKMISRMKKLNKKKNYFYFLGNKYDIIIYNNAKNPIIDTDKVYVKNINDLEKFKRKEALEIFKNRFDICYSLFEEDILYPELKIRKMKAKWGYCNKAKNLIMLNLELIGYSIDEIDYVIIHELSHLVHFNHSKEFWKTVKKYKPDYKKNKKVLKEE